MKTYMDFYRRNVPTVYAIINKWSWTTLRGCSNRKVTVSFTCRCVRAPPSALFLSSSAHHQIKSNVVTANRNTQSGARSRLQGPRHPPHTQTAGPRHGLAVSQQEAAVVSESLQQPLRGLVSDPPVVNTPDQHPLPVHRVLWGAQRCCRLPAACRRALDRTWDRKSYSGFHTFSRCTCTSLRRCTAKQ